MLDVLCSEAIEADHRLGGELSNIHNVWLIPDEEKENEVMDQEFWKWMCRHCMMILCGWASARGGGARGEEQISRKGWMGKAVKAKGGIGGGISGDSSGCRSSTNRF